MMYGKYQKIATDKIKKYGCKITLTREGVTEYDPITDETTNTSTSFDGYGILSGIDIKFVNGTNILAGDKQIMCSLEESPMVNDSVTVGPETYKVVNIEELNPDGSTSIYYKLQVRK